ncbi:hypothetical protein D3C73_1218030 [compost metagenome]
MRIDLLLKRGKLRIALLLLGLHQLAHIIVQLFEHIIKGRAELSGFIGTSDRHIVMEIFFGDIGHFFDQGTE